VPETLCCLKALPLKALTCQTPHQLSPVPIAESTWQHTRHLCKQTNVKYTFYWHQQYKKKMANKKNQVAAIAFIYVISAFLVVMLIISLPKAVFYRNKIAKSTYLRSFTLWRSPYYMFNPSHANGKVIIRSHRINGLNEVIQKFTCNSQSKTVLFEGNGSVRCENALKNIGNCEDARIYFHSGKYFVLANKVVYGGTANQFHPRLFVYNSDFAFRGELFWNTKALFPAPVRQKNWTLFANEHGQLLVFTDVYPRFIVRNLDLSVVTDTNTEALFSKISHLGHIRCSTNFVPCADGNMVCALHVQHNGWSYRTLFLKVQGSFPYTPVAHSVIYHFEKTPVKIEFASGLDWNPDKSKLHLAYGIDDFQGKIVSISMHDITWET